MSASATTSLEPSLRRIAATLALGLLLAGPPVAAGTKGSQAATFAGYQAPVPKAWVSEKPSSSMRAAQYRVPGTGPDDAAELVVYHFGPNQGGTVEDNLTRWSSQFSAPGGGPIEPVVKRFKVREYEVTTAELRGSYARNVGMGQQGELKPDQALLAGIVETPSGNLFIQLHGAARTVDAGRAGFTALIEGLRPAD